MAKRFNSVWPPPVYVAQFADGSTMRMSFATPLGKPIDYARGRRLCCGIRGRETAVPMTPDDPGYFESVEYRRVLRHFAQRLVDDAVAELCGTPMPITIKRTKAYTRNGAVQLDRKGRQVWTTHRCGYTSVPLFRTPLSSDAPATDIVDGWVEKGDETFPDPYFAPEASAAVVQLPKRRKVQSDLEKALALLARLSADDKAVLREKIAA